MELCNLLDHFFALYITHHASRNDSNLLGSCLRRTQSLRIPIWLRLYNRTRRLPPEVGADPLARFCITTEYTASQSAHPLSLACLFGEDEYLRGQVLTVHCKLESPLRELDEWTVNAHQQWKSQMYDPDTRKDTASTLAS